MAVEHELNRLDREVVDFHRRVGEAYHLLAEADPMRWIVIDADRDADDVWSDVWEAVASSALFATSAKSATAARAQRRLM